MTAEYSIIPISNDYMFCHVFSDVEKCRELIEVVLGIRIEEISISISQKDIKPGTDAHGVRLDVYAVDAMRNMYDIEMQTYSITNLGKRIRFYHSQMDNEQISTGEAYDRLRKNIVIFFCCYGDPFNAGRSVYPFMSQCVNEPSILLGDDVTSIVLCPGGSYEGVDDKLKNVLEYIRTGEANDDFTRSIKDRTVELSNDAGWRSGYMTFETRLYDENMRGYERGRSEGIEAGLVTGRTETIIELIKDDIISISDGATRLGISEDELKAMMECACSR